MDPRGAARRRGAGSCRAAFWIAAPLAISIAVRAEAGAPPGAPAPRRAPPAAVFAARHDSAWAAAVARHAENLQDAGYSFRAAEWALYLAGQGAYAPRASALIAGLPPQSLTASEFLYLGSEATRRGSATAPAVLALAARARADRNEAASTLVAAGRALGADSAAVTRVGLGVPRARALRLFTIGVLAPVNGRLARQGESFVQAAALAIEEHNRSARFPVTLMVGDTRGDPLPAAGAAADLARAGVGILIGDFLQATTIAAAAVAEGAAVPFLTPAPGRDDLAAIGPHIFRTIVPRAYEADALARAAARDLNLARLAILAPDAEGGRELADRFARAAAEHGAAVVARETYRGGEVDFGPALERLKALTPDGIFLPGTPRELMTAIPQLAYYEVGTRLLGLEELGAKDVMTVALEYLDEAFFADSYYQAPALGGESFAARYRRRFGSDPDPIASRGYVAARIAARALESGVTQPEDVAATLARAAIPRTALLAPPEGGDAVPVFRVSRDGVTPVRAGSF